MTLVPTSLIRPPNAGVEGGGSCCVALRWAFELDCGNSCHWLAYAKSEEMKGGGKADGEGHESIYRRADLTIQQLVRGVPGMRDKFWARALNYDWRMLWPGEARPTT
jgi:hypothetical protein